MKPLTFPLSEDERVSLYDRLQNEGAFCRGAARLAYFQDLSLAQLLSFSAEESRYDPRLIGILVDLFARHYRQVNPFALKEAMLSIATPQALAVLLEFALRANDEPGLRSFTEIITQGLEPAPFQRYSNTQVRPRPERILNEMILSPAEFRRWGFVANLDPYLKENRPHRPWRYARGDRMRIIADLARTKPRFRMKDYLDLLGGAVTRQQAHRDLHQAPGIRKRGATRARTYSGIAYPLCGASRYRR